jgi:hypothetical protein
VYTILMQSLKALPSFWKETEEPGFEVVNLLVKAPGVFCVGFTTSIPKLKAFLKKKSKSSLTKFLEESINKYDIFIDTTWHWWKKGLQSQFVKPISSGCLRTGTNGPPRGPGHVLRLEDLWSRFVTRTGTKGPFELKFVFSF